ncbi:MAG TPA: nucleotidyltransferase domain-containing protein [Candidatus Acidoferrales bacterium]|nr:nucleotidyltransferase domain-containing protein [Candidatus Acidoferrales bacterium]
MIPEDKIQEFLKRIRDAAGENLEAVILYGSAANGSYDPEFSDLNFLCLLRDTSFAKLNSLAAFARWWSGLKQPAPQLLSRAELEATTDVFTIELIDMQQHRRVLYGEDVIAALQIPRHMHRAQVEYELREKLVLLRQRALLADGNEKRLWELLVQSAPSFATLFRHALIVLGHPPSIDRRDAVKELSRFVAFDSTSISQVLDVRERKLNANKIDVRALFASYLDAIEKVTAAVDKAFEPGQ